MSTRKRAEVYFRPRRLGHANLWVEGLARSQSFYNEVCGLTVEFWEPDLVATFLGTGNTPHDLGMIEATGGDARYGRDGLLQIPAGVGAEPGLGHLAWELPNEAELVDGFRRARDAGVSMDMTVDHQVAHSVYLDDPDGNTMEYYCDTVRDWQKVLRGEMELITSAWDPDAAQPFTESRCEDHPELHSVGAAPVHPRRVTHAVLLTQNLARLVDFYTSVGGLREVHREQRAVYLRGAQDSYAFHLAICETADKPNHGYHHVAFELESEAALEAAEAALEQRGVHPVVEIDCSTKRSFYLKDPDGFLSEYYVRREDGFAELGGEAPDLRPYLM